MAVEFNASSQHYIAIPNSSDLNFGSTCCYTAWIKPNGLWGNFRYICGRYDLSASKENIFRVDTGVLKVGVWSSSTGDVLATYTLPAEDLYFVAGGYDGTAWRLYVDGVVKSAVTNSNGPFQMNVNWCVGRDTNQSRYWHGKIVDFRMYNRMLSADEIREMYLTQGGDRILDGLKLRYRLNDGAPGTTVTSVLDCVGEHDGTPNNSPSWVEDNLAPRVWRIAG